MSNQKSSQTPQRRFSGPELAELLERVVTEHGSTAAISEVKKVRSGGVAGFFCREVFEIVVGQPSAPPPTHEAEKRRRSPQPAPDSGSGSGSEADNLRFRALLERRINETSAEEASLARRSARHAPTKAAAARRRTVDLRPADPVRDRSPVPEKSLLPLSPVAARPGAVPGSPSGDTSSFWPRLQTAGDELLTFVQPAAGLTAVVGPLALTVPVACRLQCRHRLGPEDVTVLTGRAEIVSEPSWNLVRSGRRLVEAAQAGSPKPRLLLIDAPVELPIWVAPLLTRLRATGLDLVRYVIPGSPTPDDLIRYWMAPDESYVIDLVSRVEPSLVVELVEHDHPVATVAGVELSAGLLVAMREVSHGR